MPDLSVTININAPDITKLAEAVLDLSVAIRNAGKPDQAAPATTAAAPAAAPRKRAAKDPAPAAPAAEVPTSSGPEIPGLDAPAPVVPGLEAVAPAAPATPPPAAPPAAPAPAGGPTAEDVRVALREFLAKDTDKRKVVAKAILVEHGAESVQALKPENFASVIAKVKAASAS